jgi:hypothetical protein
MRLHPYTQGNVYGSLYRSALNNTATIRALYNTNAYSYDKALQIYTTDEDCDPFLGALWRNIYLGVNLF